MFHDNLTEEQFDNMEYSLIMFRGGRILKMREDDFKNSLISSSFSAWQMLCAQGMKDDWNTYLTKLNLVEREKLTKEQKQSEFNTGLRNAQRILDRAKNRAKEGAKHGVNVI